MMQMKLCEESWLYTVHALWEIFAVKKILKLKKKPYAPIIASSNSQCILYGGRLTTYALAEYDILTGPWH